MPHSTLYAVHLDDGIPWKEALADAPFPARVQRQLEDKARAVPNDHVLYVGLAPLDTDRKSLAPATGDQSRIPMPEEFKNVPLDDPKVERAYLNYARRVMKLFDPKFLNLGIEGGEIMSRDFNRWPHFENLYESVRSRIKEEFPDVQIGISFGLGDLRSDREARAAKNLIAHSDYVGLSFYPYASSFDEKFGAIPYREDKPWRKPLAWIRAYTDKPIALCETGFVSKNVDLPKYGLKMTGSPELQAAYVQDLFRLAKQDHYLFVTWYLAVDYDKLYAKMPAGSEAMEMWLHSGFFDGDLRAKPAWEIWKSGVEASRH